MTTQINKLAEILDEMTKSGKSEVTQDEISDILKETYRQIVANSKFKSVFTKYVDTVRATISDKWIEGEQRYNKKFTRENLGMLKIELQPCYYAGQNVGFEIKTEFDNEGYRGAFPVMMIVSDDSKGNLYVQYRMPPNTFTPFTPEGHKQIKKLLDGIFDICWKTFVAELKKKKMVCEPITKLSDGFEGKVIRQ